MSQQQEVININNHPHHDTGRVSRDNAFNNVFTVPAQRWYKEMRWSKDKPRISKQKRMEVSPIHYSALMITMLMYIDHFC